MSDIFIQAAKLSKRFYILLRKKTSLEVLKALARKEPLKAEYWVLRDLTFEISKGDRIALIGKNGSGKTTLLRILAGIYACTSGLLDVRQKPATLFRSMTGIFPDLPVIDNVYLLGTIYGINRAYLGRRADIILKYSELASLKFCPMKDLSSGQRQRLVLAIFFESQNNFLIFDESLSAVDRGFGLKFEERLKSDSFSFRTIIMTSHDNEFLRRHCRTAIWLDEGRIRMHGEVNEVLDRYERTIQMK